MESPSVEIFTKPRVTSGRLSIMTAGLTLTKEHNIGAMAEKFQEGGISALAFDYRCWGSSDGTPRQEAKSKPLYRQGH
jgi:hypothetical protein